MLIESARLSWPGALSVFALDAQILNISIVYHHTCIMSLDICLQSKQDAAIPVSQLHEVMMGAYPESLISENLDRTMLEVFQSGKHIADIVIYDVHSERLEWNSRSSTLISTVGINGRHEIHDVAEAILKHLPFKDVTEGDEEDDDYGAEEFEACIAEIEEERVSFNQSSLPMETKLGRFEPKDFEWTCQSVACSPACAAHIVGNGITKNDLQRIEDAFQIEPLLRHQIFAAIAEEIKDCYRKVKLRAIGLVEVHIRGDLFVPESKSKWVTYVYQISVQKGKHQGRWTAAVDVENQVATSCDVRGEPFCEDFWD